MGLKGKEVRRVIKEGNDIFISLIYIYIFIFIFEFMSYKFNNRFET